MGLGITATRPIYETKDGKKVFTGVLGVDHKFDDIRSFLVAAYGRTGETVVAIYEDEEPNYIIALSTGSEAEKMVNSHDPSKPCENTVGTSTYLNCRPERTSIFDLSGTRDDAVLVKPSSGSRLLQGIGVWWGTGKLARGSLPM